MVIVPLPCELNASIVAGLNAAPSEPPASGSLARIFPSFALRMTNVLRRLGVGIGRWRPGCPGVPRAGACADGVARREQNLILHIERESVAPAVVTKRIGRRHLHRLGVDHRDATRPLLEDLVDGALAVGDGLLRRAAEIDVPEHRPILASTTSRLFVGWLPM
jgi:hypothetical protein